MPDGSVRSVQVFVAVDAMADPAVAELARGGSLHHVAEGVQLAVPFCYHDPRDRVFLLVVPEVLRHRAVAFRAEQLAAIAEATEVYVPPYVMACEVVIGVRELNERLSRLVREKGPADSLAPSDASSAVVFASWPSEPDRAGVGRARAGEVWDAGRSGRPLASVDEGETLAVDEELETVDDEAPDDVEALADDAPEDEMVEARPAEVAVPIDLVTPAGMAAIESLESDPSHPLSPLGSPRAASATEAAINLDALVPWTSPARRAWLLERRELSAAELDERIRLTLEQALDWGLGVPAALEPVAERLLGAGDAKPLVARRAAGLCRTSRALDHGGLEESVLRAMWADVVNDAARLGVELSDEAREEARQHAAERTAAHAQALSTSSSAVGDVAQPTFEALESMAEAGGPRDLRRMAEVARSLDQERVARLFSLVSKRTDLGSQDVLCALVVRAEDLRVRAGAALALAARGVPEAIDLLAEQVAREAPPAAAAFSLALGRYGGGSFRAIARALERAGASGERIVRVYAHLARHGASAQIRDRMRSADEQQARICQQAMELSATMGRADHDPSALVQGWLSVYCELFDASARNARD